MRMKCLCLVALAAVSACGRFEAPPGGTEASAESTTPANPAPAQPGERIAQLAARRGAVVALLAPEGEAKDAKSETGSGSAAASDASPPAGSTAMRWLLVGEPLAWGTKVTLETAIMPGTLALAP